MMNNSPEITLEKPGLIVLSSTLSKQLGLLPGMLLVVETASGGMQLRVKERAPYLEYEDHVLVFTGEILDEHSDGDLDPVEADREQRMLALMS